MNDPALHYVNVLGQRMAADGMQVWQQQIGPVQALYGTKTQHPWIAFGAPEDFAIAAAPIGEINPFAVTDFATRVDGFIRSRRGSVGIWGGAAAVAVLISSRVDPASFAQLQPKHNYGSGVMPAIVDLAQGAVHMNQQTSLWGFVVYKRLRAMAQRIIPPPGQVFSQ